MTHINNQSKASNHPYRRIRTNEHGFILVLIIDKQRLSINSISICGNLGRMSPTPNTSNLRSRSIAGASVPLHLWFSIKEVAPGAPAEGADAWAEA
uniref:Cl9125_1 n=1 Tax=Arundo donax TaxID=35708 RepID=A0A0A9CNA2_ARUDO